MGKTRDLEKLSLSDESTDHERKQECFSWGVGGVCGVDT